MNFTCGPHKYLRTVTNARNFSGDWHDRVFGANVSRFLFYRYDRNIRNNFMV